MFMLQRRGTSTDRLVNVIQVLQLGRKTGTLTVERGEGTALETGEITFVQGHITQASGTSLTGQKALNWLSTWTACRFLFVASSEKKTTAPLSPLPTAQSARAVRETDALPRAATSAAFVDSPSDQNQGGRYNTNGFPTQPTSSLAYTTPYRIKPVEEALHLLDRARLSRAHRHLLLIIDGQRTTSELARIMGRSIDEVQRLLRDLEHVGLI